MLPCFLFQLILKKKYRKNFFQRLGLGFPIVKKEGRPLVWVHAVSLGETKAIIALVKLIREGLKNPIVLISNVTETGHTEACHAIPADYHVYLPFDFGWIINRIVRRTAPDVVILCESDFWYNFLKSAKKSGADIAVVNGKLSERSTKRFLKYSCFAKKLFACIDLLCVQSKRYQQRFLALGIRAEKVIVTGNIKLDAVYPKLSESQLADFRKELGILSNEPVIVFGSSHNPEESWLLQMMEKVWEKYPNAKAIIVPRHPERFDDVATLIQKNNLRFHRLSQKSPDVEAKVVLVDSMGLLRKCYQVADVAIVCGSYTDRIGGHNILEPLWYGVPSVFGPYMHNQPDLVDLIFEYEAGIQVSIEKLPETLLNLLSDQNLRKSLGSNGMKLISDVRGATNKTFSLLEENLPNFKKALK